MESRDPATALRDAEAARDTWAESMDFPRWHDEVIGAAVAVQIATTALGVAVDAAWARWALAGGLAFFGIVAGVQLWRFSRLNGVRLGSFASRVVFGTAATASFAEAVALVVAYAAADHELWWLVGVASAGGGLVYVISGRRWLRAYRRDPARYGTARSTLWSAVAAVLALAGMALLVAGH